MAVTFFHSAVDPASAATLAADFGTAVAMGAEAILVVIDSGGGDWNAAEDIVRLFKSSTLPVHCLVNGEAASSAFYILQACTTRTATATSELMVHEVYFKEQSTPLTRDALKSFLSRLDASNAVASELAAGRMRMSLEDFRARIAHKDWTMTPAQALRFGALDRVVLTSTPYIKEIVARYGK